METTDEYERSMMMSIAAADHELRRREREELAVLIANNVGKLFE